jgi:hypothetical protein
MDTGETLTQHWEILKQPTDIHENGDRPRIAGHSGEKFASLLLLYGHGGKESQVLEEYAVPVTPHMWSIVISSSGKVWVTKLRPFSRPNKVL